MLSPLFGQRKLWEVRSGEVQWTAANCRCSRGNWRLRLVWSHKPKSTVDGKKVLHRWPLINVNIPSFTWFYTSQVVVCDFWTINSVMSSSWFTCCFLYRMHQVVVQDCLTDRLPARLVCMTWFAGHFDSPNGLTVWIHFGIFPADWTND